MDGFIYSLVVGFFLVFVIGTIFHDKVKSWPKYLGTIFLGVILGTAFSQLVSGTMAMYIAIGIGFAVAFLLTHTHVLSKISKAITKGSKRIPFLPIILIVAIVILAIIILK
jgi:hypothetical protein